ncbi:MAG: hypothetical protein U0031_12775 [Thermomicrobiales bacterium]
MQLSRRAAILIFVGALVLIDALGRWLSGSDLSIVDQQEFATATPVATPAIDSFRAGFAPLLAAAADQAGELVAIGEKKERNLLRIRAAQEAMHERLDVVDAWLASHPPPESDGAAIASYHQGADSIRAAMREAQDAFLHLDFERVAHATETMRQGEIDLRRAQSLVSGHES